MTALLTITKTEAKLFAREPLALFFGLVFPSLLLLVIGDVVALDVRDGIGVAATAYERGLLTPGERR